jgi:two-component system OmpR family sensor kinase/two-component system sensor histidine kinase QseC
MKSIRKRLLIGLSGATLASSILTGFTLYRETRQEVNELADLQLRQVASSMPTQLTPDVELRAPGDPEEFVVVQAWERNGSQTYTSQPGLAVPNFALEGAHTVRVDGERWRVFGVRQHGRYVQVSQPTSVRDGLAAHIAFRTLLPLLGLLPLFGGLIYFVVVNSLRPLDRLAYIVEGRSASALQPLDADNLPEELQPIVAALNSLLSKMEQALMAQGSFIADAAHELRSPLTALKLQMQLLQRAPDEAARQEAARALTAGIDRAARLVEQLLTLARAEPGAPATAQGPIDLSEVVREAVAETVPFANSRGTRIELFADVPVMLQGDAAALRALARNLADNALRYAPPGSRVELRVRLDAGVPTLQVDDAGPGIPAADRERVFDRFYRHAAGDEPGTGLGLAIVRSVAQQHGASVTLGDSPLGGLRVVIRFGGRTG